MEFSNFKLEEFTKENSDHYRLVSRLASEEMIRRYISKNLSSFIKDANHSAGIKDGNNYVIKDENDDLVGIVGLEEMNSFGIIKMWIMISPDHRGKHHAYNVTKEVSDYLMENLDGIQNIRLEINKANFHSKNTAMKAGYKFVNRIDDTENYYYRSNK